MNLHPKTSGAAVGAALGVVIVGILHSINGVHLVPELSAAIPSFLSILFAWLVPSQSAPPRSPAGDGSPASSVIGGGPPLP